MRKVYILFISLLFSAGAAFAQDKVNVDVAKAGTAPVIDGIEEELWDAVDGIVMDNPKGPAEAPTLTAYWKALWDNEHIYVFINVEDDDYYPGWEAGGNGWEYDKPEIYFDVNEVLVDGGGAGTADNGHYQWSPDPTDGGQDVPTETAGTGVAPGGWYCYSLTGENWAYEFAVDMSTLKNADGVPMDCETILALPEKVGFDVTLIDQDEGVTTGRQRYVWQCGDGAEDEAWNTMDPSGTITLVGSCTEVGINTVKAANISVQPNPVTDFLTINADFDKVVINNILGQEISTMNQIKTNRIDVGDLSKGIYIIKVYKGERYIGAAKITKN
jgi:hypothetical protein